MKNIMKKSLVVLMLMGAFAVISFAQNATVQLTAGGETKALTRTLAPNTNVVITFKANAGQTISFTAGYEGSNDSDLLAYLLSDGSELLTSSKAKAPNEFLVKKTGNFRVVVENKSQKRVTTTIYLDLFNPEDMQDDSSSDDTGSDIPTEALDFTGSDQANVSKTIPANGTMLFTFDGVKGATAIIRVTDRTNKLTVIFNDPPTQKADTEIALNTDVSRKLTKTAKYTVEVGNFTAKAIKFDLEVSIPPVSTSTNNGSSDGGSSPEEIQMPAGKTNVNVKRTVNANGSIEFTFHAKKGQRVVLSANTTSGNNSDLELSVTELDSQDISESAFANEPVEFKIKTSGFHNVVINNTTSKKISFDFGLYIK